MGTEHKFLIRKHSIQFKYGEEILKKLFVLALTLIVIWVGSISVVSVRAAPVVLNVGPGQPYSLISDALAFALPGDVIHVWNNPNPYKENPVITVPDIKIIGQSAGGVTVQPSTPGTCFSIQAPRVTIMELRIEDPFQAEYDRGIEIRQSSNSCTIWNNEIWGFDYGIFIVSSANNQIIGNDISGCMVTKLQPPYCSTAVFMIGKGATLNQVRGNELGLTKPNWYGAGLVNSTGGNTITLNNFYWWNDSGSPFPQAFVWTSGANAWDSGATGLKKGNFWRDPMGFSPPYVIDPLNKDNFCSMTAYDWATMSFDLNRDGKCDMKDLATAAKAFGSVWSNFNWNPKADVNHDGKVDIRDLAIIAQRFGWYDP